MAANLTFRDCYAALLYSLIKPPRTCLRSIRAVISVVWLHCRCGHRIWRSFGLQPHRTESFKISQDPLLLDKIRDVVGLYLAPPANAVVFAVDGRIPSRYCSFDSYVVV